MRKVAHGNSSKSGYCNDISNDDGQRHSHYHNDTNRRHIPKEQWRQHGQIIVGQSRPKSVKPVML